MCGVVSPGSSSEKRVRFTDPGEGKGARLCIAGPLEEMLCGAYVPVI
jgi:hypothetical protein